MSAILDEQGRFRRASYEKAEGYVWCDTHGSIHDDTTAPFGEGISDDCVAADHRPVFIRSSKGDWPRNDEAYS